MSGHENFPVNHEHVSLEEDPFPDLRGLNERFSERYDIGLMSSIDDDRVIYKAHDLGSEKYHEGDVSIKIFTNDDMSEAALRNSLEIKLSREIDHPNVVKSLDDGVVLLPKAGKFRPFRYMVTPSAREGDITSFTRNKKNGLEADLFQELLADAAAGLSELHSQGLVHRNVRPENVLIDRDENGQLLAKIAGLSVIAPEHGEVDNAPILEEIHMERVTEMVINSEKKTELIGSPNYVAPEQMQGKVHPRSDVYSVGRVAIRVFGIRKNINNGFPTSDLGETYLGLPPEEITSKLSIPAKIGQIISMTQARDPSNRPKARELAAAVA
jgi:eukaryotic-like serine/threonine-protein kinase